MAQQERICKSCEKLWSAEHDRCPEDGGRLLVAVRAEDRIGTALDDKLTLTGVLGRGGMGVVYRAHQHSVDREVALKLLHRGYADETDTVRRFLREARAASSLSHPNIITVFDFGQAEDGELYLVMELLTGRELYEELRAAGRLPAERVVHIATQVCDALHHAHERGLVHRDLKPENVFLLDSGFQYRDFVKVLDFGVAKMRSVKPEESVTRTGTLFGTPAYMSPEQVLCEPIDRRADLYSLGVVLYELLTGRVPFRDKQVMRLLMAHVSEAPPSFAEACPGASIPPALEAVVMRCLAKNPDHRPATALALAEALVEALGKASNGPVAEPSAGVGAGVMPAPVGPEPTSRARTETFDVLAAADAPPKALAQTRPLALDRDATARLRSARDSASSTASDDGPQARPRLAATHRRPAAWAAAAVIALAAALLAPRLAAERDDEPLASTPVAEERPVAAAVVERAPAAPGVTAPDVEPPLARAAEPRPPVAEAGEEAAPAEAEPPVDEAPPAGDPGLAAVVRIRSEPVGARVTVDGVQVGHTPVDVPRPTGEATAEVVVSAPGHVRVARRLTARSADDVELVLARKAAAPVRAKPIPAAPPEPVRRGAGIID